MATVGNLLNDLRRQKCQFDMSLNLPYGAILLSGDLADGYPVFDFVQPLPSVGDIGDQDGIQQSGLVLAEYQLAFNAPLAMVEWGLDDQWFWFGLLIR